MCVLRKAIYPTPVPVCTVPRAKQGCEQSHVCAARGLCSLQLATGSRQLLGLSSDSKGMENPLVSSSGR